MNARNGGIDNQSLFLLAILSVLWGGSFMFIGIAIKELPSILIVFLRVAIAAAVLLPVHILVRGPLPRDLHVWVTAAGMSVLNNILPFSAIVYGQHHVSAGLAAILNATTPLFGAMFLAIGGDEPLTSRKIVGLFLGLVGVVILRGTGANFNGETTLGLLAVLLASASYGLSGLWAKRRLNGMAPLTSATCQLVVSSIVMFAIAGMFNNPSQLLEASKNTWMALFGLAILSTAIAYLIFFRIIARSDTSVVMLVTMIIPVSAMLLGKYVLNEIIEPQQILGAAIIGVALVVLDGRAIQLLLSRKA